MDEGRAHLARQIEWVSDTRGDGLGYDIQSFDADGSPRLIEVKTTGLGKDFPFIVTANEVRVSGRDADRYQLYRLFNFGRAPHLYRLRGDLRRSAGSTRGSTGRGREGIASP